LGYKVAKRYDDFMPPVSSYDGYFSAYPMVEKIQSNSYAMERSVFEVFAEAYRSGVKYQELRFCPMLRTNGGENDMDRIISSAINGFERAADYYGIDGGLILCMDRKFTKNKNFITLSKAIKYSNRGVVGVDLAGDERSGQFDPKEYSDAINECKDAGLGVTIHCGEVDYEGVEDYLWSIIDQLSPHRIGHGLMISKFQPMVENVRINGTVLELCPMSNLLHYTPTQLSEIYTTLIDNGITVIPCTDADVMCGDMKNACDVFAKLTGRDFSWENEQKFRLFKTEKKK
jgi:adenosine deaminase